MQTCHKAFDLPVLAEHKWSLNTTLDPWKSSNIFPKNHMNLRCPFESSLSFPRLKHKHFH